VDPIIGLDVTENKNILNPATKDLTEVLHRVLRMCRVGSYCHVERVAFKLHSNGP
jgi:hypothetical protein